MLEIKKDSLVIGAWGRRPSNNECPGIYVYYPEHLTKSHPGYSLRIFAAFFQTNYFKSPYTF